MNEFEENMSQFWLEDFPNNWTFLWSPEEAQNIPQEHKEQIHFIDKEGTIFFNKWINSSRIYSGLAFSPCNREYFKTIEQFTITWNCEKKIKKWLYSKGIPFSKWVFIDYDRSGKTVMLTWKMVIKYWEGLFFADDLIIVDSSLQWGLFYFHESELFFGKDVIFNGKKYEGETIESTKFFQKWQENQKNNPHT